MVKEFVEIECPQVDDAMNDLTLLTPYGAIKPTGIVLALLAHIPCHILIPIDTTCLILMLHIYLHGSSVKSPGCYAFKICVMSAIILH